MATSLLLVAQEQAPSFAQNPGFLNADRLIQEDSFHPAFDFANATKQLRAFRDHVDKVEALNPESGHLREHIRVKEHIREAEDVVDIYNRCFADAFQQISHLHLPKWSVGTLDEIRGDYERWENMTLENIPL